MTTVRGPRATWSDVLGQRSSQVWHALFASLLGCSPDFTNVETQSKKREPIITQHGKSWTDDTCAIFVLMLSHSL
jgi:hypothetical protein